MSVLATSVPIEATAAAVLGVSIVITAVWLYLFFR